MSNGPQPPTGARVGSILVTTKARVHGVIHVTFILIKPVDDLVRRGLISQAELSSGSFHGAAQTSADSQSSQFSF